MRSNDLVWTQGTVKDCQHLFLVKTGAAITEHRVMGTKP